MVVHSSFWVKKKQQIDQYCVFHILHILNTLYFNFLLIFTVPYLLTQQKPKQQKTHLQTLYTIIFFYFSDFINIIIVSCNLACAGDSARQTDSKVLPFLISDSNDKATHLS